MPPPKKPSSPVNSPPASEPSLEARIRPTGIIEVRDAAEGHARILPPDDPDFERILDAIIDGSAGPDGFIRIAPRAPAAGGAGSAAQSVGVATMLADGTLELQLRSDEGGAIAEALLVVPRGDPRYASMLAHLGPLEPGASCAIRPFP